MGLSGLALPAGWERHISRSSGQPYYYNSATGENTYTRPALDDAPAPAPAPPEGLPPLPADAGAAPPWHGSADASAPLVLTVPQGMAAGDTMVVTLADGHQIAMEIPMGLGAHSWQLCLLEPASEALGDARCRR